LDLAEEKRALIAGRGLFGLDDCPEDIMAVSRPRGKKASEAAELRLLEA
jgi:hypothetical protein